MARVKNKKQKIINTAIKLFVKNGVHNTSMQALAKKAGVATGSIYNYFDSKDALIVDVFYSIADESTAFVTKHYDVTGSVKERFCYLLEQKIRFNVNNPNKFRFMSMCVYEPIVMRTVQDADSCNNSPLAAVITDGKAEGIIKDLPLEDLFYHFFGGIASLVEWRLFNRQQISDSDIANMIAMSWDAISK